MSNVSYTKSTITCVMSIVDNGIVMTSFYRCPSSTFGTREGIPGREKGRGQGRN